MTSALFDIHVTGVSISIAVFLIPDVDLVEEAMLGAAMSFLNYCDSCSTFKRLTL